MCLTSMNMLWEQFTVKMVPKVTAKTKSTPSFTEWLRLFVVYITLHSTQFVTSSFENLFEDASVREGCGLWVVGCGYGLLVVGCGLLAVGSVGCGLWAVGCGKWPTCNLSSVL